MKIRFQPNLLWWRRFERSVGHAKSRGGLPIAAGEFGVAEASGEVVDHQPGRLQIRITDGGSDKAEAPPSKVSTEGLRKRGRGGHLVGQCPPVDDATSTDEPPEKGIEAAHLFLYSEQDRKSTRLNSSHLG